MSDLQPDQVSFLLSQESARTRNRILSAVTGDQCIARVDFTVEADKSLIRFTYFETSPGWRRQGVAKALLIHLMHEFPQYELVEGGGPLNSEEGNGLLAGLRAKGYPYHGANCFTDGLGCRCELGGRQRSVEPG